MEVRLRAGNRLRKDLGFGGIVYIPHRDDFFALNYATYEIVNSLTTSFTIIPNELEQAYKRLAEIGICETRNPFTKEVAYSGPSFIGKFPEIPSIEKPLVVNCFSTAFCPLKCIYCHADDLMCEYRERENNIETILGIYDIENVISTARMIPAMVAVITGGDPLMKPKRTEKIIEGLSNHKSLVLDTSGFGEIDSIIDILMENNVHIRVSLDSLSIHNNEWRPINPLYRNISKSGSSLEGALTTIEKCLNADLGLSVQTVIHSKNDNIDQLRFLRDGLIGRGVRNWIIHIAVRGGKARKIEEQYRSKSRGGILPNEDVRANLATLIRETIEYDLPIDIRCTDNDSTPNSVLLINSEGDLFTEGLAHLGKVKLYDVKRNKPDQFRAMWSFIDWPGHTRRYLNWNKWSFGKENLEKICYQIDIPKKLETIIESKGLSTTQKKYRIKEIDLVKTMLNKQSFFLVKSLKQTDEYFDTKKANLNKFDYILRIREEVNLEDKELTKIISFIGPKFYVDTGQFSQFELNFQITDNRVLYDSLKEMGLEKVFTFEKRRDIYKNQESSSMISIDHVPELGLFLEISGEQKNVENIAKILHSGLYPKVEFQNYRDLYIELKNSKGEKVNDVQGPVFPSK